MPSGPIQNLTPGLLSLMQLKNLGRLPGQLLDTVGPSLDMEGYWLRGQLGADVPTGVVTLAPANFGFSTFSTNPIQVPSNQWWWCQSISVRSDALAAGESVLGLQPAVQWGQGGSAKYASLGSPSGLVSGANAQAVATALDIWLPPGCNVGVWVSQIAGVSVDIQCDVYRVALTI